MKVAKQLVLMLVFAVFIAAGVYGERIFLKQFGKVWNEMAALDKRIARTEALIAETDRVKGRLQDGAQSVGVLLKTIASRQGFFDGSVEGAVTSLGRIGEWRVVEGNLTKTFADPADSKRFLDAISPLLNAPNICVTSVSMTLDKVEFAQAEPGPLAIAGEISPPAPAIPRLVDEIAVKFTGFYPEPLAEKHFGPMQEPGKKAPSGGATAQPTQRPVKSAGGTER